MPNWVWVVFVIVAVLGAGLLRERWRMRGMAAWCATRGCTLVAPFVPGERPPVASLVKRFDIRGGRIWGAAIVGVVNGVEVTIAEHETSPPGKKTGVWQVVLVWPVRSAGGPVVLWPGGGPGGMLSAVLGGSYAALADRLGVPDADPSSLRASTEGGLLVEGTAGAREAWLTESRRRALEAWRGGGAFAIDGAYAAWRTQGLLSPSRLQELADQLPAVRRLLE
jgi:hypothetical protein